MEETNVNRQEHVCVGHKGPSVFVRLSSDKHFFFVPAQELLPPAVAVHASIYNPKFK